MSIPRVRIYEKEFKYVPAAQTDVAKTFARVRKEMALQAVTPSNVKVLQKKAK